MDAFLSPAHGLPNLQMPGFARDRRPYGGIRVAWETVNGRPEDISHDGQKGDRNVSLLRDVFAGDPHAVRELVDAMAPVIQARVARALLRRPQSRGRDVQQEVADLTQDVFVALFADDAKALRAWKPTGGLSLANFIGLLAERRVASLMRVKRRTPWADVSDEPPDSCTVASQPAPDSQVRWRQLLERLLDSLRASLSPRGLDLFYRLYVDEQPIEVVCEQTRLSPAAVYQWKTRLGQAARAALAELQADPTGAQQKEVES